MTDKDGINDESTEAGQTAIMATDITPSRDRVTKGRLVLISTGDNGGNGGNVRSMTSCAYFVGQTFQEQLLQNLFTKATMIIPRETQRRDGVVEHGVS
jgi:hypothetical protein